jgi:hypothetical protein
MNANDLRAAAQYIRDHGWRRRKLGKHGGPRCMVGAMLSAVVCDDSILYVDGRINRAFQDVTGGEVLTVFNDEHCKTANDAIAVREIAADLAS